MSLFLLITLVALLAVFSLDVRQKRREYLKQEKSTKQEHLEAVSPAWTASAGGKARREMDGFLYAKS